MYEININNRFDDEVKCSILDIFVPVAHHITRGGVPEIIGKKISITKELSLPKAQILENEKRRCSNTPPFLVSDTYFI